MLCKKNVGSRDLGCIIEVSISGGDVVDDGVRRIELVVISSGGPIAVIGTVPAVLMPLIVVIPIIVMPLIIIGLSVQCGDTCPRANVIVDEDIRLVLSVDDLDAVLSQALPRCMAGTLLLAPDAWSGVVQLRSSRSPVEYRQRVRWLGWHMYRHFSTIHDIGCTGIRSTATAGLWDDVQ